MSGRTSLLFFLLISFIIHISMIYYFKPSFFLISNLTNIKIQKNITKVKFVKIKPKIKKRKKRIKVVKIKQELSAIPKIEEPLPIPKPVPEKKVIKQKTVVKKKPKITLQKKKVKKTVKKKKKKAPPKKIDLSSVKKRILMIKKREKEKEEQLRKLEEERKLKEKLKKEAAYFYSNKLVGLIQSLWIFPKVIKDYELPNLEIKVKLRVRKDGKIIGEPQILSKSKNEIFNDSALRAIEKLNKYKIPLPDVIDDKFIDIIITLTPPKDR